MEFYAVLDQVVELLRQRGRVTYRALKLQFDLDDNTLETLKEEIIDAQGSPSMSRESVDLDWELCVCHTTSPRAGPGACTARLHATPSHRQDSRGSPRPGGRAQAGHRALCRPKDSTELIRGLDPEAAQRLLDPAIHLMMDAVHRFEGTVNQVLGDGIMALFGAPIAHEDHALRACYAALAMQAAMQPLLRRCAARAAWSCACGWASTRGKWWCGRLWPAHGLLGRRRDHGPGGADGADGHAGEHPANPQHPRAGGRARAGERLGLRASQGLARAGGRL